MDHLKSFIKTCNRIAAVVPNERFGIKQLPFPFSISDTCNPRFL